MADTSSLQSVDLKYRIAKCTGYSGKYAPEHIVVNTPGDQTSRWSGHQTASSKQWIILELTEPSLVRTITFGKFHKAHPCNMKEFKVYIGRTMDTMTLALHDGLNNDTIPETFDLQRPNEAGLLSPMRFVKIVPLSAHSLSFNTSIWHVALSGINDRLVVSRAEDAYASYKETTTLRHVLKYLRQRRHFTSFRALQSRTGLTLEHPIVTKIYDSLLSGKWLCLEGLIKTAADEALFDDFIKACDPTALWHRLNGANPDGDVPTSRGGHQMCIDAEEGIIYMFGGWDGKKNLDDLWAYSIAEGRWKLLNSSTLLDGGPGPRSCHKMVFDPLLGYIYLLGCLDEGQTPRPPSPSGTVTPARLESNSSTTPLTDATVNAPLQGAPGPVTGEVDNGSNRASVPSPFYRYTTRGPNAGTWTVLSVDTQQEGGPPLISDHQMAIDSEKQMLYVFGGRIVNDESSWTTMKFSGLYQYNIETDQWEHLLDEATPHSKVSPTVPARWGHSMVFDTHKRRLIIFAGKKRDASTFLADVYSFDVTTQEIAEMISDFSALGGPDPCFCQRAAVDPESGHIYVLPGLMKVKEKKHSTTDGALRSTFWIFKPETLQWTQVSNSRSRSLGMDSSGMETEWEPQPRYAHQMVYDHVRKRFYVHGGNSGQDDNWRLDDFWSMKFERPTREEMVRRAKFIARRQQFKELCETVPSVQALTFLQQDVHAVVDHFSEEETATFRALQSHLFDKAISFQTSLTDRSSKDIHMTNAGDTNDDPGGSASGYGARRSMPGIPELEKDDEGDTHSELTPELFRQRTLVFESFLELINTDAKQPSEDLINLVEVPGRELL